MKTTKVLKLILKDILLSFLAGICISIGAIAYLSCDVKYIGALFFTVGLFIILVFNFNLFTGKLCYVFENKFTYFLRLFVIWIGNFIGTFISAELLLLTRLTSLQQKCIDLCNAKLSDSLLSLFILAIFCNILIFVAVHGFKKAKQNYVKVLALFFGVSVFVLCGFEHCVADMFYFIFSGIRGTRVLTSLLVITAGNFVGGVFIPLCYKMFKNLK